MLWLEYLELPVPDESRSRQLVRAIEHALGPLYSEIPLLTLP